MVRVNFFVLGEIWEVSPLSGPHSFRLERNPNSYDSPPRRDNVFLLL